MATQQRGQKVSARERRWLTSEYSGEGGGVQCSPMLSAGPGKHSDQFWIWLGNATLPDGHLQNLAHPLMERSTSCHLLVLRTRCWAPPCPRSLRAHPGTPDWCDVLEEWEARRDVLDGEALTVILKSPWLWAEVALRNPEELEQGMARGIPPRLARRYLERSIAMVMFPQWEHDSSTSAASVCWKPKHEGQLSWPSDEARKTTTSRNTRAGSHH